jgi:hypothetical protein
VFRISGTKYFIPWINNHRIALFMDSNGGPKFCWVTVLCFLDLCMQCSKILFTCFQTHACYEHNHVFPLLQVRHFLKGTASRKIWWYNVMWYSLSSSRYLLRTATGFFLNFWSALYSNPCEFLKCNFCFKKLVLLLNYCDTYRKPILVSCDEHKYTV